MRCPECVREEFKSKVNILGHASTAMGTVQFFDENGMYHCHDSNIMTTQYSCTNGHYFKSERKAKCWCGYGGDK